MFGVGHSLSCAAQQVVVLHLRQSRHYFCVCSSTDCDAFGWIEDVELRKACIRAEKLAIGRIIWPFSFSEMFDKTSDEVGAHVS